MASKDELKFFCFDKVLDLFPLLFPPLLPTFRSSAPTRAPSVVRHFSIKLSNSFKLR